MNCYDCLRRTDTLHWPFQEIELNLLLSEIQEKFPTQTSCRLSGYLNKINGCVCTSISARLFRYILFSISTCYINRLSLVSSISISICCTTLTIEFAAFAPLTAERKKRGFKVDLYKFALTTQNKNWKATTGNTKKPYLNGVIRRTGEGQEALKLG
jgi:hypothetical protein